MDLYSMIQAGGRMNFTVTGEDLVQFAETIIEKTIAMRDSELAMAPKDETYLTTDEVASNVAAAAVELAVGPTVVPTSGGGGGGSSSGWGDDDDDDEKKKRNRPKFHR